MNYSKQLEEVKTLNNPKQEKAMALAMHLKLEPEEGQTLDDFLSQLTSTDYDQNRFEIGEQEYLVLTDSEADEAWEESLDNYIDECILPELAEPYRQYFDSEGWKEDASMDGRGHSLNHYDGSEYDQTVNGTDYYIYRTN